MRMWKRRAPTLLCGTNDWTTVGLTFTTMSLTSAIFRGKIVSRRKIGKINRVSQKTVTSAFENTDPSPAPQKAVASPLENTDTSRGYIPDQLLDDALACLDEDMASIHERKLETWLYYPELKALLYDKGYLPLLYDLTRPTRSALLLAKLRSFPEAWQHFADLMKNRYQIPTHLQAKLPNSSEYFSVELGSHCHPNFLYMHIKW